MKKKPIHQYEKTTGKHGITATMACESALRQQQWTYTGCNSFEGKIKSRPFSFWTENDILSYLKDNKVEYCSLYGDIKAEGIRLDLYGNPYTCYSLTGVKRTGCMYCMFGAHLEKSPNRFEQLRITHPAIHEWCLKSQDEGGLGLKEVLDYCKIKY